MRDLLTTSRTFTLILAVGLSAMAARNVTDPDLWWHLKTGQLIAQNHKLFRSDPFSSTRQGHPWLNHEWLPDLFIFSIYRMSGFAGLIIVFAAVIAAGFMVLYSRSPGKPYVAGLCTLLGALTALPSWGARPQMLAFVLASILLWILERSETKSSLMGWVVPLIFLWVNLHGSFPVGIVLIALFLAGELAEAFLCDDWGGRARLVRLGAVLGLSILVVPLNPYGFRLFAYPLQTLSSKAMQEFISEWASPDFHRLEYTFLLLMLLGLIAGSTLSSARMRLRDSILLIPAMLGALISARHIYFFVLIAVPVLARAGSALFEYRISTSIQKSRTVLNGMLVASLFLFALVRIASVVRKQNAAEAAHFPARLVQFLKAHPLPESTLNYYNWGGYMIWKLYPEYRVFVDGRADLYGDDFLNEYAHAYYLTNTWDALLDKYRVQAVILPPDAPLITALKGLRGWKVAYADEQATVIIKQ